MLPCNVIVMKTKILHIDNSMHPTGAFKALVGLCDTLPERYTSVIALPQGSTCANTLNDRRLRVVYFPFHEIRKSARAIAIYLPYLLLNAYRLVRFVKKEEIGFLHSNDHFNLVPILTKIVLGRRIKLVVHVRLLPSTYNYQLYGIFRRLNVRYADRIIGVSEAIMDAYGRPGHMLMIRDRISLAEKLPVYLPEHKPDVRFVYMSNYIQGKGQNFAVEAFCKVAGKNPQATLHFYGGTMGLEKNELFKRMLQEKVISLQLDDRVYFHDFAPDVEAVYKEADISLCFSESESFSLICIESQFFGVPVIATACGGPQEIIHEGEDGLLVENRNVDAMAAAMDRLLNNFALRKQLSQNGKENARRIMHSTPAFSFVLEQA